MSNDKNPSEDLDDMFAEFDEELHGHDLVASNDERHSDLDDTGFDVEHRELVEVVDDAEQVGMVETTATTADSHEHTERRRVQQCPGCDWTPSHAPETYDQPPELLSNCELCGTATCTRCHVVCETCGKPLCPVHRSGFGGDDATLCPEHAAERREEREFEAKLQVWEQVRQDAKLRIEYQIKQQQVAIQRVQVALKERADRNQERIQLIKAWLQENHRVRQHNLQVQQARLEKAVKERQLALQEFETAAKLALKKQMNEIKREYYQGQLDAQQQKLDLQEAKLDFQRLKHDDQMNLKHRQQRLKKQKTQFQQQIQAEKHELQQIQGLLSVDDQLDSDKVRRNISKAAKKLSKRNGSLAPEVEVTV